MILPLLLALQAPPNDSLPQVNRVTIPRLEAAVRIDGVLDEPVWQNAARMSGFHQFRPVDSRPAEEDTEVLIWYAPNAIYFGVRAHDRESGSIRATVADRDNLDSEDRITIYLDTFNDRRRAFFFTVNPLGAQEDGVRTEGGFTAGTLFGGSIDKSPDYLWQSKGQIGSDGYVVEIRIPFKSLRYPGRGGQTWGLNIVRNTQRTGYEDTWTDTRRANASFLVQAGTMDGLHDLQRGIVTEIQPFATASANGNRTATGFEREDINPSVGVNLRLGLTSNLSLDATYNPDFSQIESDVSLVTVNERFALFFPEKRPFFLEGIELFATPNQQVYTRQIVDPIAGGKVTAKLGDYNVAYLSALDQSGDHDAWFNVARVRRDVGQNSTIGLTATSREAGAGYNRVVAGDARFVFGKLYYAAGQLGGSWTRDDGATSPRSSPLWEAEFDRTGRSWGFNYKVTGIGTNFESQSGFVPRNDITQAHAFNRFSIYGGRGALLEQATFFGGPFYTWLYRDFPAAGALEGYWSAEADLILRGGWALTARGQLGFVDFEPGAYDHYTVQGAGGPQAYNAPDGIDTYQWTASVATPTWQTLNGSLAYNRVRNPIFDEGSRGIENRVTGSVALRPNGSVRITGSTTYSRITRAEDGSEFARTIIPRLKLEYQPIRALFFRAVGEYVAARRAQLLSARDGAPLYVDGVLQSFQESDRLRLDLLASFEPTPGTVAFLGYGSSLDDTRAFGFRQMERESDGFFVKLAYLIRR